MVVQVHWPREGSHNLVHQGLEPSDVHLEVVDVGRHDPVHQGLEPRYLPQLVVGRLLRGVNLDLDPDPGPN